MSMTKRHLESLPEEEQNAICGDIDPDYEAWWASREADEANLNIRASVSGNMDEEELTRRLVEDGDLEV